MWLFLYILIYLIYIYRHIIFVDHILFPIRFRKWLLSCLGSIIYNMFTASLKVVICLKWFCKFDDILRHITQLKTLWTSACCDSASFFLIPVVLLHLNLWMMLSIHRPNTEKRKGFTPRLNCHGATWGVNQVMYSCSVWVRKWAAQPLKYRQTVSFCLGAWVMVCPRLPYSENTKTKVLWLRHVWLNNISMINPRGCFIFYYCIAMPSIFVTVDGLQLKIHGF